MIDWRTSIRLAELTKSRTVKNPILSTSAYLTRLKLAFLWTINRLLKLNDLEEMDILSAALRWEHFRNQQQVHGKGLLWFTISFICHLSRSSHRRILAISPAWDCLHVFNDQKTCISRHAAYASSGIVNPLFSGINHRHAVNLNRSIQSPHCRQQERHLVRSRRRQSCTMNEYWTIVKLHNRPSPGVNDCEHSHYLPLGGLGDCNPFIKHSPPITRARLERRGSLSCTCVWVRTCLSQFTRTIATFCRLLSACIFITKWSRQRLIEALSATHSPVSPYREKASLPSNTPMNQTAYRTQCKIHSEQIDHGSWKHKRMLHAPLRHLLKEARERLRSALLQIRSLPSATEYSSVLSAMTFIRLNPED